MTDRIPARCSFCSKPRDEVRLIGGPDGIFICEECVALSVEILDNPPERRADGPAVD